MSNGLDPDHDKLCVSKLFAKVINRRQKLLPATRETEPIFNPLHRKTCLKRLLKKNKKTKVLTTNVSLMKVKSIDPQERSTWRSGVRSAMRAASQSLGAFCNTFDLH